MKKAIKRQWLALILGTVGLVTMTGYLQKTQLNPTSADATLTLQGKAIEGTMFTAMNQQGDPIMLTIRQVELDPTDPDHEIYLYTVFYRHSTASQSQNAQWHNLCQPDRSGVAKAIPLSGEWDKTGAHLDNDQITFACTGSAQDVMMEK